MLAIVQGENYRLKMKWVSNGLFFVFVIHTTQKSNSKVPHGRKSLAIEEASDGRSDYGFTTIVGSRGGVVVE